MSERFATSLVTVISTGVEAASTMGASGAVWKCVLASKENVPVPNVSKSYREPSPVWLTATEPPAGMVV